MLGRIRALRKAGVVGLNARNAEFIMRWNRRELYPLVDNKILCKRRLEEHGIAVPGLLNAVRTQHEASHLAAKLEGLERFVLKPARGSGGDGILVVGAYRNDAWVTPSGQMLDLDDIQYHVSGILNGMYSLAGQNDEAIFETLVVCDARLRRLAPDGVPDIRVIVYRGVPVMAMVRLPTRRSGGKANLHQGAIGAGIAMNAGQTLAAVMENRVVQDHPDTGESIRGFSIPDWRTLLELSARCHDAVGLGYLGVDIVLDEIDGPLVLELNARPGLAIQIANSSGLGRRTDVVDQAWSTGMDLAERLDLAQSLG